MVVGEPNINDLDRIAKYSSLNSTVPGRNDRIYPSKQWNDEKDRLEFGWQININRNYTLTGDVIVEDTLGEGHQLLFDDNGEFYYDIYSYDHTDSQSDGKVLDKSEYTLELDGKNGFKLTIPNINQDRTYTFLYKTEIINLNVKDFTYENRVSLESEGYGKESAKAEQTFTREEWADSIVKPSYGTLELVKYSDGNMYNREKDVEFGLYNANTDELIVSKKTDDEGKIVFDNLSHSTMYYIKEISAPNGLIVNPNATESVWADGTSHVFYFNNEIETTNVSVTKHWNDEGYESKRPNQVTVDILANGVLLKDDGYILSDDNDWTVNLTELPVYDRETNTKIEYKVIERDMILSDGKQLLEVYEPTIKQDEFLGNYYFTVENTYQEPEEPIELIELNVKKLWNDNDDLLGLRPETIKIYLLSGSQTLGEYELTEANNWELTIENLPKFDDKGQFINYSINEESLDNYQQTLISQEDTSIVIENTVIEPEVPEEYTELKVTKVWDDENNALGLRPSEIRVKVTADNEEIDTLILNELNNWSAEINHLSVYTEDGDRIEYDIVEESVDNYILSSLVRNEDVFTITNTVIEPEVPEEYTELKVTKVWDDENNALGLRPSEIRVKVTADNEEIDTLILNELNNWSAEINHLSVYTEDGDRIEYDIVEESVDNYILSSLVRSEDVFTITNTVIEPEEPEIPNEYTSLKINKSWDDNGDLLGLRPNSIQISIYGDDVLIDTVILSESNNWEIEVHNLPKYDENGLFINYSVSEEFFKDYKLSILNGENNEFELINKVIEPEEPKPEEPKPEEPKPEEPKPEEPKPEEPKPEESNETGIKGVERERPKSEVKGVNKEPLPQTGMSAVNYAYVSMVIVGFALLFLDKIRRNYKA